VIAERFAGPLVIAALAFVTGCSGARTNVTADEARYPISLSRAVRDADGEIVAQERAKKVADFQHESTSVAVFYSFAGAAKKDISRFVNEQVAKHGGDAIVNLKVGVKNCGANWVPFFYILPFWPGCATVQVQGDIVKVAPKVHPAPSPASPTSPSPSSPSSPSSPASASAVASREVSP